MKTGLLAGVLGVVFVGGFLLGTTRATKQARLTEDVALQSGRLEGGEENRLGERVASQAAKIAALEAALSEANAKLRELSQEEESAEARPASGFRRQMEGRVGRRVEALAERLGLTELQKAGLLDVFMRRLGNLEARRQGEEVEPFNLDAELQAVLTPEQFAAYMEETQEEIYNRAELIATAQLVRMNQIMGLDPAMQGMVYEAVHLTAQEMMIARETGATYPMRDVLEERLGTLLTEEQMQILREEGGGMGGGGPGMRGRGPQGGG
jgi:hypothetical protein